MRIDNWNPEQYDGIFEELTIDRLEKAAEVVKRHAKRICPIGTISRPIYKKGPYAGVPWTARDRGQLNRSIRVVKKFSKSGRPLKRQRNIRIYAGNFLAYYASIVEYAGKAFLRPALTAAHSEMMDIVKGG